MSTTQTHAAADRPTPRRTRARALLLRDRWQRRTAVSHHHTPAREKVPIMKVTLVFTPVDGPSTTARLTALLTTLGVTIDAAGAGRHRAADAGRAEQSGHAAACAARASRPCSWRAAAPASFPTPADLARIIESLDAPAPSAPARDRSITSSTRSTARSATTASRSTTSVTPRAGPRPGSRRVWCTRCAVSPPARP